MFRTATQIAVSVDERNRRSVLELIAGDRPGLLCDIGKVLMEERVDLLAAKIMTVGERAEDVFYLALAVGRAARRGPRPRAPAETLRHARSARRPREPASRPAHRLSLRTTGSSEGGHHAAFRVAAHRHVHRRAETCAAGVRGRSAARALGKLDSYPATAGLPETREACAAWLKRRFGLGRVDAATMVLPVNGTREALFSFVQAVVSTAGEARPAVAMPNPFYQIYEGAALAGRRRARVSQHHRGQPLSSRTSTRCRRVWQRCEVLFLCSPAIPPARVVVSTSCAQLELASETIS
jgi:hypothetical protein